MNKYLAFKPVTTLKKNLIGLLDDFQSSIFQNRKGRFLVVCTDGISILS